jgi:ankyrin repeat protein
LLEECVADALKAAIAARDLAALKRGLRKARAPVHAKVVGQAAGAGWLAGLKAIQAHGADLNATYRNYRPMHALIQEKPHAGGSSTQERVRCLEWLLEHGADPQLQGAWPLASAIVIAAGVGEGAYVRVLKAHGASAGADNIFAAAALGETTRVQKMLARLPSLATAREQGVMTALMCCASSRLGSDRPQTAAALAAIAEMLIEAGADVTATARSWSHDVEASYFAVSTGQRDVLHLLIDHGARPTAALTTAVWRSDFDTAEYLIGRGADVNAARDDGKPLLNNLIRWGQFKPARWLLSRGARIDLADERGWTAVDQAISRGNRGMLEAIDDARTRGPKTGC